MRGHEYRSVTSDEIRTTKLERVTNDLMTNDSDLQSDPLATSNVLQSAFCASLRSKKFFMIDVVPTDAEQYPCGMDRCAPVTTSLLAQ